MSVYEFYIPDSGSKPCLSHISDDILVCCVTHCHSMLKLKLYWIGIRYFLYFFYVYPLSIGRNCIQCYSLLRLENIIYGIKKSGNNSVNQKLPMTKDVLHKLQEHFENDLVNKHLDFTLVTAYDTAFFSFFKMWRIYLQIFVWAYLLTVGGCIRYTS